MVEETKLKNKIMRAIRQRYPYAWIWKISDRFRSGVPDLLVIYRGYNIFIEIKTPKGRISAIQRHTMQEMQAAGGRVFVARSVGDVLEIFSQIEGWKGGDGDDRKRHGGAVKKRQGEAGQP